MFHVSPNQNNTVDQVYTLNTNKAILMDCCLEKRGANENTRPSQPKKKKFVYTFLCVAGSGDEWLKILSAASIKPLIH